MLCGFWKYDRIFGLSENYLVSNFLGFSTSTFSSCALQWRGRAESRPGQPDYPPIQLVPASKIQNKISIPYDIQSRKICRLFKFPSTRSSSQTHFAGGSYNANQLRNIISTYIFLCFSQVGDELLLFWFMAGFAEESNQAGIAAATYLLYCLRPLNICSYRQTEFMENHKVCCFCFTGCVVKTKLSTKRSLVEVVRVFMAHSQPTESINSFV